VRESRHRGRALQGGRVRLAGTAVVQVYERMNGGSLPFDEAAARELAERHFARARDWAKSANHHRISEKRNEPQPWQRSGPLRW
jgi:hypothetical protein